jgi:uncharacterized protein (UPF0264 family)
LGAADGEVWREVSLVLSNAVPISAALGELADAAEDCSLIDLNGFDFAKMGLAGCASRRDWPEQWNRLMGRLPVGVQPVAVVYADWTMAAAPSPEDVVHHAAQTGCAAILVDTYEKTGRSLLDHLSTDALRRLIADAKGRGMKIVLGGSLGHNAIRRVAALDPDFVAVRGAVCRNGRSGEIDQTLVRRLADLLPAPTSTPS